MEFYGRLELAVALSAALTPLWIFLVRQGYIAVGGTLRLGLAGGTLARLLLSAGIGAGSAAYWLSGGSRAATLSGFAATCALEALCLIVPYALGDRIAVLAILLRPVGAFGLAGYIAQWTLVTALVAFPAAFVAGFQFPLLIALLGRGREHVGP